MKGNVTGAAMIRIGMIVSCLAFIGTLYLVFGGAGVTAIQQQIFIELGILVIVFMLAVLIVPGMYYANRDDMDA